MDGLRRLVCAGLLTLLCACNAVSIAPVGTSQGAVQDDRLLGNWTAEMVQDGQTITARVTIRRGANGTYEGTAVVPDGNRITTDVAEIRLGRIGAQIFANMHPVSEDGRPMNFTGYIPLMYRIQPDGAVVVLKLDADALAADIRAGRIAGMAEQGGFFDDIRITADAAAVDRFFTGNATRLFKDKAADMRRAP